MWLGFPKNRFIVPIYGMILWLGCRIVVCRRWVRYHSRESYDFPESADVEAKGIMVC